RHAEQVGVVAEIDLAWLAQRIVEAERAVRRACERERVAAGIRNWTHAGSRVAGVADDVAGRAVDRAAERAAAAWAGSSSAVAMVATSAASPAAAADV